MPNRSNQKILKNILNIAKFYGAFYLPETTTKNRYICIIITTLLTTSYIIIFVWSNKHFNRTTTTFMECMVAIVLLCVELTEIFYTFNTQATFKELLKLMDKIETVLFNLHEKHLKINYTTTLLINYFVFFSVTCFYLTITLLVYKCNFQIEFVLLFILFHSMNVVVICFQCIGYYYETIFSKFMEIMVQYFTLPPEKFTQIEDSNSYIITGWVKSVLEKRKDERIESVIVLFTVGLNTLNTMVYLLNKIHKCCIIVFFIVFTSILLEFMNMVVVNEKLLEKFISSIKTLFLMPFSVSMCLLTAKTNIYFILFFRYKF